jgi:DNA-binding FadR family transcriptional regulator
VHIASGALAAGASLPSERDLGEQFGVSVRKALEVFAVRAAAARRGGPGLERIAQAPRLSLSCAQAADQEGFREHDFSFHRLIAAATDNPGSRR